MEGMGVGVEEAMAVMEAMEAEAGVEVVTGDDTVGMVVGEVVAGVELVIEDQLS